MEIKVYKNCSLCLFEEALIFYASMQSPVIGLSDIIGQIYQINFIYPHSLQFI